MDGVADLGRRAISSAGCRLDVLKRRAALARGRKRKGNIRIVVLAGVEGGSGSGRITVSALVSSLSAMLGGRVGGREGGCGRGLEGVASQQGEEWACTPQG